jgi:hypothetical protein
MKEEGPDFVTRSKSLYENKNTGHGVTNHLESEGPKV